MALGKKFSTAHAKIDFIENIQKDLDGQEVACGIFIDLEKAFDTVNHILLLKKLAHYWIRGTASDHTYRIACCLSPLMVTIQTADIENVVFFKVQS